MPKTYVTFGQIHAHSVNGKTVDKDTVARIECTGPQAGRSKAFELFGDKFCFAYYESHWDEAEQLPYFPKGYVDL